MENNNIIYTKDLPSRNKDIRLIAPGTCRILDKIYARMISVGYDIRCNHSGE